MMALDELHRDNKPWEVTIHKRVTRDNRSKRDEMHFDGTAHTEGVLSGAVL